MARRSFLIFIMLTAFVLLVGCSDLTGSTTEDDNGPQIRFSDYQSRFDMLPDGISASSWESVQQDNGNTIHKAALSCDAEQCQYSLEVTANGNGRVLDITLQSRNSNSTDPCFAEVSYHIFCSTGFTDADGKGNAIFTQADQFYDHFEQFSDIDVEDTMWINNYAVSYTHQSDGETRCFAIRHSK